MVERLGTEHAEVLVFRAQIADVFPTVIRFTERPILRTAPAPLFLLSKLVRDSGIKVVLTGEGSEQEMLGGYDLFREAKVRRFLGHQPELDLAAEAARALLPLPGPLACRPARLTRQFFGRGLERAKTPGFSHEPRWSGTAALKRLFSPALKAALAGHDAVQRFVATLPEEFSAWPFLAQDQSSRCARCCRDT